MSISRVDHKYNTLASLRVRCIGTASDAGGRCRVPVERSEYQLEIEYLTRMYLSVS